MAYSAYHPLQMTALSIKAQAFLSAQKRNPSTIDRDEIIDSFELNGAPVFEPLIDFQQKYSGYVFKAGLAPIHFGILQGDGGFPYRSGTAIVDFDLSDTATSKYQFVCATTLYQMDFTLDEYGRYYEDYEIVASSFDKFIEHLAIWNEMHKDDKLKILFRERLLETTGIDKKLNLTIIPEASDQYTLWFKNESTYLKQCNGKSTIITSDDFEKINTMIR